MRARTPRARASRRASAGPTATAPPPARSAAPSDLRGLPVRSETAADDLDDRLLGPRDLRVAVVERPEHPAGQDLLERAVEDEARQPRVDIVTKLARFLSTNDDPLDGRERRVHVGHSPLQLRTARHLADDDANEIGIAPPRAQHDLRDPGQPPPRRLLPTLHPPRPTEH